MEILTEEELRDRMTECYDEMCLYSEKGDYKKAIIKRRLKCYMKCGSCFRETK